MSSVPAYTLEIRAADQRKQIHSSVIELRSRMRQKLDVKWNLRQHVPLISGVAAVASLLMGYGFAGIFTRH